MSTSAPVFILVLISLSKLKFYTLRSEQKQGYWANDNKNYNIVFNLLFWIRIDILQLDEYDVFALQWSRIAQMI
jgi:hypothetical protein